MGKKKKKKAAKEVAEPGKPTKDDNVLPKAKAKPPQIDTLVTLVRQLDRKLAKVQRQQTEDREERRGWEQREQERQESAPSPPAPWEAAFASLPEFMAEMRERVGGIESRLQQPPRDPNLDVPASVMRQQELIAGACKTMNLIQPTPAIIGRLMHDHKMFDTASNKAPRNLFELIHAKNNIPDHLSQRIRSLLLKYGTQPPRSDMVTSTDGSPADQQQRVHKKPGRVSSGVAEDIGSEFDRRFALIENMKYGRREPVRQGKKTNYCRYLMPKGREVFENWPEWTDATGGIGLADEPLTPRDSASASRPDAVPITVESPPDSTSRPSLSESAPTEPTTTEPAPAANPTQPPT